MAIRPGRLNRFVALSRSPVASNDADGFFEDLTPSTAWCSIQPIEMTVGGDSTRIQISRVVTRFHPQITVDTRLVYRDQNLGRDRELFVKSVQNVDDDCNELVLACEEVWP
jgi:head-tail adaptor